MLREYFLEREDRGVGSDVTYTLVFSDPGEMYVKSVQDYSQPYKKDTVHRIYPQELAKIKVNGRPLSQMVVEKLEQILPLPK